MIKILSELGTGILFVEKPSGLSMHNDPQGDLISVLEKQLGQKIYPIHRLDKETSGIVAIATNAESAAQFAELFQSRDIQKTYLGVCRGKFKQARGKMDFPLSDKAEGRKNPQGLKKDQKDCLTEYQVLHENDYFSAVAFTLHSGRQHQIRKHCALLKHSLLNDPRYGDPKYNEKMAAIYKVSRLMLHAAQIKFRWQGKEHVVTSWNEAVFPLAGIMGPESTKAVAEWLLSRDN